MIQYLAAGVVLAFPALVIMAALKDATSYTIPNAISAALLAIFPLAALLLALPLPSVALHAGIGFAALLAGMAMFALGWIGGGDAKLFAAAALWLGWPAGLTFLVATCLAGGALAMGLITLRSVWLRPYVMSGPAWFARLAAPGENVPYGVAIAAGALAAVPVSPLMAGLAPFV
ncbi:prepilin peptidase [Phenylobacterium sp.]|jgi:prepilin peptidase CpaA|uniref:prepilin peptidase n=1 Tax=Phenylobacterium sp. TaxID=1871053 RepID=UPI003782F3CF